MAKIRAILFDMDGVLIDAREWHYDALNKALRLFGMEISRFDHLVTYDGLPTRRKLEMLTKERGLPEKLHQFINHLKQIYTIECVNQKCAPVFEHEYALARLKNEGLQLAVCSNSIRNSIELMMQRAKLIDYLEFFLSNEDVAKAKPDPEIYSTAIQRLNLQPEECLIVEDNDHGVKAALASGAHLLRVGNVSEVNYSNISRRIKEIEASC